MKIKIFRVLKIATISVISIFLFLFILAKIGCFSLGMNKEEPIELSSNLSSKIEKLDDFLKHKIKNITIIYYYNVDDIAKIEKDKSFKSLSNTFDIYIKIIDTVSYRKDSINFNKSISDYMLLSSKELQLKKHFDSIKVNCNFYTSESYSSDISYFSKKIVTSTN